MYRRIRKFYDLRHSQTFLQHWPEFLEREDEDDDEGLGPYTNRRSERWESLISVLCALLSHLDFDTCEVVVASNETRGVSIDQLVRETGLTLSRVERTMRMIRRAKILSFSQRRFKTVEGCKSCRSATCGCGARQTVFHVAAPSLRKITPRFFLKLGHDVAEQFWKLRKKRTRRTAPPAARGFIDLRTPTAAQRKRIFSGPPPREAAPPPAPTASEPTDWPARDRPPRARETTPFGKATEPTGPHGNTWAMIKELIDRGMSEQQAIDEVRRLRQPK